MNAITIRDLHVSLGGVPIIEALDLDVAQGQWLNVIGANGAGKTTMLRAILSLVDHRGSIDIEGLAAGDRVARARAVAYVPQSPVIPPGVSVADYVLLGRTPHRGVFGGDSASDRAIASEALERLDLLRLAGRDIRGLSGGERQRAVIARGLTQQSEILVLDEPTTALDLGHQLEVLDLIDELRVERGLTVLATLHDLTLAGRFGNRLALLSCGRVETVGEPAAVLTERTIAEFFGAQVRIIDDVDGPVIVPAVARSHPRSVHDG
ncbi:MAG: ABC transporter ATP-binding protein [Actinomycetota bacterium]